jgi:hypothetical protein
MFCATAAPTRYPPGEAHSLPAPASLVTTFASGPLPANRASEVASRRLAAHSSRTRHPLSSPLSLSATPQLHPLNHFWTRVAKNAVGDTRRHATASPHLGSIATAEQTDARGPVTRGPVAPPVVTPTVNDDAPTSTRPTSSVWCRPKRSRRHKRHATQFAGTAPRLAYACRRGQSTFGLLDLDSRVRKSKSRPRFSSHFHHNTSRNKGSNAPRPAGRGKTFGPL